MGQDNAKDKKAAGKGFWARLMENIDKKMVTAANSCGSCCCGDSNSTCEPKSKKDK